MVAAKTELGSLHWGFWLAVVVMHPRTSSPASKNLYPPIDWTGAVGSVGTDRHITL
jgi:hypothetical protein